MNDSVEKCIHLWLLIQLNFFDLSFKSLFHSCLLWIVQFNLIFTMKFNVNVTSLDCDSIHFYSSKNCGSFFLPFSLFHFIQFQTWSYYCNTFSCLPNIAYQMAKNCCKKLNVVKVELVENVDLVFFVYAYKTQWRVNGPLLQ